MSKNKDLRNPLVTEVLLVRITGIEPALSHPN